LSIFERLAQKRTSRCAILFATPAKNCHLLNFPASLATPVPIAGSKEDGTMQPTGLQNSPAALFFLAHTLRKLKRE
jgi:hypothetical protein